MTLTFRSLLVVALVAAFQITGAGQTVSPSDLRDRLRERFDVVTLQRGVALVPRDAGSSVRMIQVVDGVVTVDGDMLTGAQMRERLGSDADLVLQVSYLDRDGQQALAGGGAVTAVTAAPASSTTPVQRDEVRRGDIIRFGDDVRVGRNERVEGDVVTFGGEADIDGEITGDLVVFGGSVRLGPDAVVRGDVNAIGGNVERAQGAQVLGGVTEVGRGGRGTRGERRSPGELFGSMWSRFWSVGATALRLTVLVLLGLIVAAFGRNAIEQIGARIAATPVRSGLIGLAGEILFLPVLVLTIVVLAVSIVGIPLLLLVPFAVLALMLVALIGFVGLAYQVGGRLAARFGWSAPNAYAAVAIGVAGIGALTLLGKLAGLAGGFFLGAPLAGVGYVLEYVAWTAGFGAALLYFHQMQPGFLPRRQAQAPAAPAAE